LASLKLHTRMHTGEEPFSCLVCKKSFHWSSVLRKHLKINSEIKSYSCSRCSNYFISLHILKCSLKEHVYCIFLPKWLDKAPFAPPHLSGQYRPELGHRSIESFTVPLFQGQHRPLRGGVGFRFPWPLTGKAGVKNVKEINCLCFQNSLILHEKNDERGDRRR
jgi:transcription elongation factor Elf1